MVVPSVLGKTDEPFHVYFYLPLSFASSTGSNSSGFHILTITYLVSLCPLPMVNAKREFSPKTALASGCRVPTSTHQPVMWSSSPRAALITEPAMLCFGAKRGAVPTAKHSSKFNKEVFLAEQQLSPSFANTGCHPSHTYTKYIRWLPRLEQPPFTCGADESTEQRCSCHQCLYP